MWQPGTLLSVNADGKHQYGFLTLATYPLTDHGLTMKAMLDSNFAIVISLTKNLKRTHEWDAKLLVGGTIKNLELACSVAHNFSELTD